MAAVSSGTSSGSPAQPASAPAPSTSHQGGQSSGSSAKGGRPTGDDIFGHVDGGGKEPVFGVEEISRANGQDLKKPAKKAKGEPKGHALRAEQASEIVAPSDQPSLSDLEAYFQQEIQPPDPNAEPLTEGEEGDLSPREQNRMQVLANRSRAAEERAQAAEAAVKQSQQQFEAMQGQLGQYLSGIEKQNARLQAQVEMLMHGRQTEQLDPSDRIEQELIGKARDESRKSFDPEIKALRREIQNLRQTHDQDRRQAETMANKQRYSAEGQSAARDLVLKGLPEDVAERLLPRASSWVLSYAWANRTSAAEAAKMVRRDISEFSLEFIRAQSRLTREKKDRADAAPRPPPQPRGNGAGEAEPTWQQLRAAGYKSFLDWDFAGRPALTAR